MSLSPDVLATLGEPGTIVDCDGVHLAMSFQATSQVVPGSSHRFVIALQNCWNAERTIAIQLRPTGINVLGVGQKRVNLVRLHSVALAPLEVGRLTLRLSLPTPAWGRYRVYADFKVTGDGGQRLVRNQRPAVRKQVSVLEMLLVATAGYVFLGRGGHFVELEVTKGAVPADAEIPEVEYARIALR